MMLGGQEEPCVDDFTLDTILAETGRQCPRVELAPRNGEIGPVAMIALMPKHSHFTPLAISAWVSDPDPLERVLAVRRMILAVTSDDVALALEAASERARSAPKDSNV